MTKVSVRILFIFLIFGTSVYGQSKKPTNKKAVVIEPGVSSELAFNRRILISNIQYTLSFDIPPKKSENINAAENVTFDLNSFYGTRLLLDFKQDSTYIKEII